MYKCNTCEKEYTSQKRYLNHIENCDYVDNSSKRSSHSVAVLSDVEDDFRSLSRSRNHDNTNLEQLMKDKAKYKIEIKKYKAELRSRVEEHRNELERIQEYFQKQLIDLTEKKDELLDQVNSAKEELFNEKERLRSEFSKKITTEKNRLENRYSGKNTAEVRLQSIINKLQKEKEALREEFNNDINTLKEAHRVELNNIQGDVCKYQQALERERDDVKRAVQLLQAEKDSVMAVLHREKEQALYDLTADKDTVIHSLEHIKSNLQREKELLERNYKCEIQDLKCSHEIAISDMNRTIEKLKDNHAKAINQNRSHIESKLSNMEDKAAKDMQIALDQHQLALATKEYSYSTTLKNIKAENIRQIEELTAQIATIQQKMIETENCNRTQMDRVQKNAEEKMKEIQCKTVNEKVELIRKMEKEHNENVRDRDHTINELERLNHILGAQIGHYHSAIKNMETDTSRIKQQFVTSLNQQKEENIKAISERETKINTLEKEIQNIRSQKDNHNKILTEKETKIINMKARIRELESMLSDDIRSITSNKI